MVAATVRGQGRSELRAGHGDGRGGDVDPGLPLQPFDAEGSERSAAVWNDAINRALGASVRDDVDRCTSRGEWQDRDEGMPSVGGGLCAGDDGYGGYDNGGSKRSLSGLEEIEHAQLPDVSNRHWAAPEEATAGDTELRVRREFEVLEADPNKLDKAVDLSLDTALDILEMEYLPTSHSDYMKQLTLKKDTAVALIGAGLKADENRFRRKQQDVIARLFEAVQRDKKLITIDQ